MTPSDFLSPVVTSSFANIAATNNATGQPDPTALVNPNRTAMLVDVMRFRYPFSSLTSYIGAQIQAELFLGGIQLTNGPTPLAAFCPNYTEYVLPQNTLTWNLPRPLYVPPNVPLTAKFTQKLPQSTTTAVAAGEMGVSVVGRSMPAGFPIPKSIYVPWVSSTSVYSAVTSWQSADNELGNPFSEPMRLTRMVGWNGFATEREIPGPSSNIRIFGNRAPDFFIQATFSNQKMLIRDPTPFYAVFPGERPFMRLNNVLQPKEFIRVYLDMTAIDVETSLNFTTVGMIGFRELQTPQGALP